MKMKTKTIARKNQYYLKAFTLVEMLIVLAIIGLLVLLVLPNFTGVVNKARSTEAKLQLKFVYDLQKTQQLVDNTYSKDLEEIGFIQEKLVTEGGEAVYRIEVSEATNNTFVAKAIAVQDFDGDGVFNVWEINQDKKLKETVKD